MTIQFKKFLVGLATLLLGFFTFSLGVEWYLNWMGPNTFGGEVQFFIPVAFLLMYLYYKILVKLILNV